MGNSPPVEDTTIMNNININDNTNNENNSEVDPEKSAGGGVDQLNCPTSTSSEPSELKAKQFHNSNWVAQGTNVLIVICISAMTLCLRSDMISVTRRGFYCDDLSIHYPKKPETVSTKVLIIASTLMAWALFSLTEYSIIKQHKFLTTRTFTLWKNKSFQIPAWMGPSLRMLLTYFMGAAANSILTDIAKNVIGWPRPNFMDTCRPLIENVTCANITGYKFITTFKCMSGSQEDLEDALKSFPSGHASFVGFVAFFIVFYIHERFRSFGSVKTTLRPFLQLIVLGLCWWSALTRVKDYVHHPVDVLAGLLIGSGVAFWSWPYMNELLHDIDGRHKTLKYNLN